MEELAKLFILLIAVALFIQLVKRGTGGPTHWLKVKFLGEA